MKRQVIVISGSMVFHRQMDEIKKLFEDLDFYVYAPSFSQEEETQGNKKLWYDDHGQLLPYGDWRWTEKAKAMHDYFSLVDGADVLFVYNADKHGKRGYIGANTFAEMVIAFRKKIPIILYKLPSEEVDQLYGEELRGMGVRTLNETPADIKKCLENYYSRE